MFKKFLKVSISLIFFCLFISSNVFAFHKGGKSQIEIEITEGLKKRDLQIKYCTSSIKKFTKTEEIIEKDENKTTKEQSEEFDSDKQKTLVKKEYYEIKSYHSTKATQFKGLKSINTLKDLEIINASTPLSNILSFWCVQNISEDNSKKVYKLNEKVKKLYNELATDNGLSKASDPIGDEIFKLGLIKLERNNLIYSDAQFIIDEQNKKRKVAAKKAEANKKTQEEKNWVAANKQPLLDEIDKKINGFDDQISKVNNDYKQLKIDYEGFKIYFKEKIIEVEDLLEDVDRSRSELKEKAKELRSTKREFLSDNIIDDFKNKFKATKRVKAKNFPDYKKLEKLRDSVANAKKRKDFEKKNGFNDRWEILKTSKLNIKQEDKIGALSGEIKDAKSNITDNIDNLIIQIQDLEEEFGSKLPWKLIIIGIIVFLIICAVGAYVYLNNRRIKNLQEEADKKVGSLKSDLEDKFKNTTEQIKSATKNAARAQQSGNDTASVPVQETPKTPEEIISARYDELVSEYKEALEDFSKVAAFKQKWHGLALSRKERQDGTKTILVSSTRAFEKAEIWCVTFSEKYFAFPGSTVKSNMATYMNLDFEKAGRDFKGVFAISSGSNYSTEPSVLRRGGAGFVVERAGTISFPN
jgi:hypothetical protein